EIPSTQTLQEHIQLCFEFCDVFEFLATARIEIGNARPRNVRSSPQTAIGIEAPTLIPGEDWNIESKRLLVGQPLALMFAQEDHGAAISQRRLVSALVILAIAQDSIGQLPARQFTLNAIE